MRSIRSRLLVVVLLVAVVAVLLTAWAVNRTTSSSVRGAVEADFEVEEAIYEELSFFAFIEGSWEDVGDVVDGLAEEFHERIALTTVEGVLIADSADGEDLGLPDEPARYIDPGSPVISFDEPLDRLVDTLSALEEQATGLADALEEAGVPFDVQSEDFGLSFPVWDLADPEAGLVVRDFVLDLLGSEGLPLLDLVLGEGGDVLGSEGLSDLFGDEGLGGAVLEDLFGGESPAGPVLEELFGGPFLGELFGPEAGFPFGFPSEPASPALLFLGTADQGEALPDPIGWRLLAIVAGVALLAVVAAVIASRRLLQPIGALTDAAHRMESGDLGERVEVGGGDELATLAGAFNAMAGSLEEQDRLRRTLTGDIAHELRTPLSNLRGYLEAIHDGVLEPTPELIGSLHEEAQQLQRLVDDLQDLASAEAGELRVETTPTELLPLLDGVVQGHQRRAEEAGVGLELHAGAPVIVDLDPARVRQVIGNLIDNAIRHTPDGSRVDVEVALAGDHVLVAVADTGEGIPAEHLPHVFERFYRADTSRSRETGGSGLGLAIARELARAHGGDIEVESVPDAGSRFTVRLPLHSA
jgi:two-component system sensor histidine kinase BaeS